MDLKKNPQVTENTLSSRSLKKLGISIQTWNADFSNYFNYKDKDISLKEYKIQCQSDKYFFVKINNEFKVLNATDLAKTKDHKIIFTLTINDNCIHFESTINLKDEKNNTDSNSRLWRIIKPNDQIIQLEEGSILKLGRSKFLVKHLVTGTNSSSEVNLILNDVFQFKKLSPCSSSTISPLIIPCNFNPTLDKFSLKDEDSFSSLSSNTNSTYKFESESTSTEQSTSTELISDISNNLNVNTSSNSHYNTNTTLKSISNTSNKTCRICLSEEEDPTDPIISPCQCKGSMEFIHLSCLRIWMKGRLNINENSIAYFLHPLDCELCKSMYPNYLTQSGIDVPLIDLEAPKSPFVVLESLNIKQGLFVASLSKKNNLSLGRSTESDIRIQDLSVSRIHSLIKFDGSNFYLKDHGSKFGTFLQPKSSFTLYTQGSIEFQFGALHITLKVKKQWKIPSCFSATPDLDISTIQTSMSMSSKFLKNNNKLNSNVLHWLLNEEQ